MNITTTVEITAEEARKLLGMPEYSWLQETYEKQQEKAIESIGNQAIEWHKKHNPFYAALTKENNT